MSRLILRRLLQLPLILVVIYTITLTLAWLIPGSPLDRPEGRRPPPEVEQAMLAQYDLDSFGSFYVSYLDSASGLRWLRERLLSGATRPAGPVFDLGPSLHYEDWRVNDIVAAGLPVSVALGASAMLIALAIGLTAGVLGALRPGSLADNATLLVALIGISLPNFVVGTALLLIFPVWLGLGHVAAWGSPEDAILPALTLSLPFAAYIARLTRMGMIEQLASDHVRTARAKGLSETRVVLKHALKNAFLPVLSFLGPATAGAMTGSFVVERVFNVPGIGQHFVNAVHNKDLFLIIGVVLVYATMLILFNLVVDVLYRWADPRIS
jgi:oligopeptide transport system permease protein